MTTPTDLDKENAKLQARVYQLERELMYMRARFAFLASYGAVASPILKLEDDAQARIAYPTVQKSTLLSEDDSANTCRDS